MFRKLFVTIILGIILSACTTAEPVSMIPTVAYTLTLTPIAKPQPTPTSTLIPAIISADSEKTACNHPYFPLRVGNSWTETYSTGFSVTRKVIKVNGNAESSSAEVDNIGEYNNSARTSYICNQDGVSPAIDKNTSYEGVFLPSPKFLRNEYSWHYSINYENSHLSYSFSCKVMGIKHVQWNNQTVDALSIECQVDHTDTENIQHEYSVSSFFLEGVGEIMWNATEGGQMVVTEYDIQTQ